MSSDQRFTNNRVYPRSWVADTYPDLDVKVLIRLALVVGSLDLTRPLTDDQARMIHDMVDAANVR